MNLIVTKVAELELQNADVLKKKIEAKKISESAETDGQKFQQREQQLIERLENATLRLNAAEKKVQKLQLRLTQTDSQFEALTAQLMNVKQENKELRTRHETSFDQTTEGLKEFSAAHRDCDVTRMSAKPTGSQTIELQTIIEKVESQLQSMTTLTKTFGDLSPRSQQQTTEESERRLRAMADDFEAMRRELERLMSLYEQLQRNSQRQKLGSKNRYNRLKEDSRLEREEQQGKILRLENELKLTRTALEKEREHRDTLAKRQRDVLTEQRNLIARSVDQEEMDRQQKRQLVLMQMQSVEEARERESLIKIVDDLTQKHSELRKIIGQLQAEKQKVEWYKLVSASAPSSNVTILSSSGDKEKAL